MSVSKLGFLTVLIFIVTIFAFTHLQTGSIKGTVSPAEGGVRAWAETSSDTIKADIVNGAFEIVNVKAGSYLVIIEARPPYRNAAKENVTVQDGQSTDAGEIKLEK
jgi:hypothetical protein